ncbi:MAG TPA: ATP-binding protein [Anaeromyxobacteraceae bacterium]|jgi:signal transduction histidine kinase|nr:ATP-binding protein [Anaeromyxobacteraceae bacterium]
MRSVATRIFATFAVALLAFGLVTAAAVRRLHVLGRDLQLLNEGYLPLTRTVAQLDVKDWATTRALELKAADPAARRVWLPVARAQLPLVRDKIAEGRAVVARAQAFAGRGDAAFLAEVDGRLAALSSRWTSYDAAAQELFDALETPGRGVRPAELEQRAQALRTLGRGLSQDVKLLSVKLETRVSDRVHATEREESKAVALLVIYALLAAAVAVGAAALAHRLVAPIRTLTEGVKAVAAGDLSRKVAVRGGDELSLLAGEFNAMAASLSRQRAELLAAERLAAVGRISAQITHEIRNPLNSIGLNTELLSEELAGLPREAEARQLVGAIAREVDRLEGVAEEYLRFARLPRPALAREDLNEILSGLLDFLEPEMKAAGVAVRRDLAGALPAVRADEGQLRAAFLNLLRNSREAMSGGGSVAVRTRPLAGGGVEAQVADDGPGIPPESLPRIFEPFWSTKEKGTGLGLAFTSQVVKEHGGEIACESAPGRGTTFTVRLPAALDDTTERQPAEAASA